MSSATSKEAASGLAVVPWTREDVEKLRRSNGLNDMVRAILDLASETDGDWVTYGDAKARSGLTDGSGRAALAGLTRHVKSRFGRTNWPFRASWQRDDELSDGQMHYLVPANVLQWWRESA
jgi:hypothetical protein